MTYPKLIIALVACLFLTAGSSSGWCRTILVEDFANTGCPPCYNAENMIDSIAVERADEICVIRYHVWWPDAEDPFYLYNVNDNTERNTYYENQYVPHVFVDGFIDAGADIYTWDSIIAERLETPSPLAIDISGNFRASYRTCDIDVSVHAIDNIVHDSLRLFCVLTESSIYYESSIGINLHNQTMRKMYPDHDGQEFSIDYNERYDFDFSFYVEPELADSNLCMVAFVQSCSTREVLQSAKVFLSDIEFEPVEIEMIPHNPPVVIPAGGSFEFTGILRNNTDDNQAGDVWIMLNLPNGSQYGPIQQFNNIPLSPYQTLTAYGVTQEIPSFAPSGTYRYTSYYGIYPQVITDYSSFEFEVLPYVNGSRGDWNLDNWFGGEASNLPGSYSLQSNYPNPFNAETVIGFDLPENGNISLDVYNLNGQKIETLANGFYEAGNHSVKWDGSPYSSGIYFYKLTADDRTITRQMTLLK